MASYTALEQCTALAKPRASSALATDTESPAGARTWVGVVGACMVGVVGVVGVGVWLWLRLRVGVWCYVWVC